MARSAKTKTDTPQWANRIVRYGEMPANEFLANPSNPRRHPAEQRDALRGSFDALGIIAPVLINSSGYMIDGHARVEECLSRDENMLIPFIEVDLSPEEEALALASFDWITQMATYDRDALSDLLSSIDTDNEALQTLLDQMAQENGIDLLDETPLEDMGAEVDRGQELAAQYGTALGQIWQLGKHRLAIGDSTDSSVIAVLMDGKKADVIITDPPYGMALDASYSNSHVNSVKNIKASKGYADVIGDDKPFDRSTISISANEEFWFGADYYVDTLPDCGKSGSWLVWDKRVGIEEVQYTSAEFELCWSKNKHQRALIRVTWFGALGTESQDVRQRIHPTQKPTQVISQLIERFSKPGQMIADPFLGSGTTLIAAHQTGRICYGCEISPEYAAVCIQRWETLTGETARLITPRLDTDTHEIAF